MKLIRLFSWLMVAFMLTTLIPLFAFAEDYTKADVLANNNPVQWISNPIVVSNQIFVPLKEMSSALMMESSFDINGLTARIRFNENTADLKLDNNIMTLNGKNILLSAPMRIIQNRVMVPLKMFESLGAYITVRNTTTLVYIPDNGKIVYRVVSGDALWKIAQMFGTTYTSIKSFNNLSSDSINVGQQLVVKVVDPFKTNFDAVTTGSATIRSGPSSSYTSVNYLSSGVSLKVVGKYGDWYSVITPKGNGYIYYTVIRVFQSITDTNPKSTFFDGNIPIDTSLDTISYTYYTVAAGDTLWSISEKMGILVDELMSVNGLTWSSSLSPKQVLKVPVHKIAVKKALGSNYGEVLDWFKEGQYVFPITKVGKLIDPATGLSFNIQRTMGANHSDTETLTAQDTQVMKQLFGGVWSWSRKPFILEVDGRRFAVSVSGMPHAGVDAQPYLQNVDNRSGDYGYGQNLDRIKGNQMDGHFDMYFLNGLRHVDNKIDSEHQKMVMIAGGLQ